ncbi:phosphoenolpyruvate carboxykinase (ATP) [Ancylobacter sp. MQZ15Z-1]|uniref:Phosphoenolpyruvate carboxykinase (ATP) n=1 Tax=Ancylobacter mangrovi TaxID=2972472 RepID=A0A9X2PHE4_9HYPH|nr:phosphoenolpyruvate carboxykinase (ATP) [Ancylobacter mangrovi]MCS0495332.1 phosphoenolpyruvate carboxykinase (ATP) [Ancylobacter mangrovi]
MHQTGIRNQDHDAAASGLAGPGKVFWNLTESVLYERAVARGEARLTATGALAAEPAPQSGRGPVHRCVVRDEASEESIAWDGTEALSREHFEALKEDILAHAAGRTLFAQDLHAGADPARRIDVRVYTEHAWQSLFARNMLRQPEHEELLAFAPQLTLLCAPGFRIEAERHGVSENAVVAGDLAAGLVLIAGTLDAGEIRQAIVDYVAYLLAERGVLPLEGAANVGEAGDVALFLGLSGTGKSVLTADPARRLIGDGAIGWSPEGVFNLEGGCYGRIADTSITHAFDAGEPAIAAAAQRFGTVLENVPLDPDTRVPDLHAHPQDARAACPLAFIAHADASGRAGTPRALFMLTCDTFGVMPPIARLTPAQAMYHFLSGYSGQVAEGPNGAGEPQALFHAGFAASFAPRQPSLHGQMLGNLIAEHDIACWLVNNGWTGGRAGTGTRVPVETTLRLVAAALDGSLAEAEMRTDPYFGFAIPAAVEGVDARLLDPSRAWASRMDYAMTARRLVGMFTDNFTRFETAVDDEVRHAQPRLAIAAE